MQIGTGPWQTARLDTANVQRFSWRFWSLDWANAAPDKHTITSRAIDNEGHVQPAKDDPLIANKITYWESNGQITRQAVSYD